MAKTKHPWRKQQIKILKNSIKYLQFAIEELNRINYRGHIHFEQLIAARCDLTHAIERYKLNSEDGFYI